MVADYVLAYRGRGGMAADEAERDKMMAAWGQWFGQAWPGPRRGAARCLRWRDARRRGDPRDAVNASHG